MNGAIESGLVCTLKSGTRNFILHEKKRKNICCMFIKTKLKNYAIDIPIR